MYRKRMQPEQYFKDGKRRFGLNRSTVTTTGRLQRLLVGLLLACCLLILMGVRASPTFRRLVCSRGKLGILNLGYEYYLATPDLPDNPFSIQRYQTGYTGACSALDICVDFCFYWQLHRSVTVPKAICRTNIVKRRPKSDVHENPES